MIETTSQLQEVLQSSLRFCLHQQPTISRFGRHGLDLCVRLSASGSYLHLFAAVDIVCSFFSVTGVSVPRLPVLDLCNQRGTFAQLYRSYSGYVGSMFDSAFFGMIVDEARWLMRGDKADQADRERYAYEGLRFLMVELAAECPFTSLSSPFSYSVDLLKRIEWTSLTLPERKKLSEQEERELLEELGFPDKDSAQRKGHAFDHGDKAVTADPRFETLFATVFRRCRPEEDGKTQARTTDEHKETQGTDGNGFEQSLSRLPYLLDYKLVDSYIGYFNQFDPDDELRHRIAVLKHISRLSIDRSPFISEYSGQWISGMPNPAFLIQGLERFLIKMMEGEPVFLGKPDPIYDKDRVNIKFYVIDELMASCEKAGNKSDRPRFTHLNLHKLCALLVAHDLVRHLGNISKMDVGLEFILYSDGAEKEKVQSTGLLNTRIIRAKANLNEGFIIRNGLIQNLLLIERGVSEIVLEPSALPSSRDVASGKLQSESSSLLAKFFENLDSHVEASWGSRGRSYDFFFGRGGLFLMGNGSSQNPHARQGSAPMSEDPGRGGSSRPRPGTSPSRDGIDPTPDLAELTERGKYVTLPNHQRAFVCETGNSYVFAGCSGTGFFRSLVIDDQLDSFLTAVRRYVLALVTEEAIQFRLAYNERMRR